MRNFYLKALGLTEWVARDAEYILEDNKPSTERIQVQSEQMQPTLSTPCLVQQQVPTELVSVSSVTADASAINVQNQYLAWETIQHQNQDCHQCVLSKQRIFALFGQGEQSASIMFIGHSPSREEDLEGRVIASNMQPLFTQLLSEINYPIQTVYVTYLLKCHPYQPHLIDESVVMKCATYLFHQWYYIAPDIIVFMDCFAQKPIIDQLLMQFKTKHPEFNPSVFYTYGITEMLDQPLLKKSVWQTLRGVKLSEKNDKVTSHSQE